MKNGSPVYFIIAVLVLLITSIAIYQFQSTPEITFPKPEAAAEKPETSASTEFLKKGDYPTFITGVKEPGNIRLELKPEGFESGILSIRFYASAHDLVLDSYDFGSITTLEHKGRKIKPDSADKIKGHHGSGLINFRIGEELSDFSVTVEGLPKEELRVFKW